MSIQKVKSKIVSGMTEATVSTVSDVVCPVSCQSLSSSPLGPNCRHRHVRRVICVNYLTGFCPEGPRCKFRQSVNICVQWNSSVLDVLI